MDLTNPEKLILIMLSEIHEKLGIENGIDPKFVQSAIHSGNTWGLSWEYSGIVHDGTETPEEVAEVSNILDMWSVIEHMHQKLSPEDKERLQSAATPFGEARFRGFDGNEEGRHMSIARFLIDDLGRFGTFKGRDLNSHMPSLDAHRRMLALYLPLRSTLILGDLTVDQLAQLLNARRHSTVQTARS